MNGKIEEVRKSGTNKEWSAATAKSANLLRWFLTNSWLRFQLFDSVWWCRQQRAGVEKSLLIYQARDLSLWALWFIDDAILMFRNLSQLSRLLPEVFQLFADMGLAVNLKVLPLIPCALPPCLAGYSVRSWATYLGQTIKLIEGDAHMVSSLCRRATSAFFANRPLLTHRLAPRSRRLDLFTSLVTDSIRWSLCVVSVKQSNLTSLRVHFVTLLTWMLGGRAHPSWFAVECLQALRHAVELWGRTFTETWDRLLARMVWRWVGHVLRVPPTSLVPSVLLGLQSTASLHSGLRRRRTGPNNSGHRNVIRYLQHRGISLETALDR